MTAVRHREGPSPEAISYNNSTVFEIASLLLQTKSVARNDGSGKRHPRCHFHTPPKSQLKPLELPKNCEYLKHFVSRLSQS